VESQFFTVNDVSCGNAASIFPISVHSFERQPIKETVVIDEQIPVKSETTIVRSLNLAVKDGIHNAPRLALISSMHCLSFAMRYCTSALDKLYGFLMVLASSISLSIFATVSPVASPTFSGSPLSSFWRSYLNFK
jgi:hypothetical protein